MIETLIAITVRTYERLDSEGEYSHTSVNAFDWSFTGDKWCKWILEDKTLDEACDKLALELAVELQLCVVGKSWTGDDRLYLCKPPTAAGTSLLILGDYNA
jgi:pimeloyl-CoA synthetase